MNYLILLNILQLVSSSPDEFRLIKDVLTNYNSKERPVANFSDAVNVAVKLILQQILEVDAKNQKIKLVMWTQLKWFDYKMTWDPEIYDGITSIRLPLKDDDQNLLWKPDILLFNSAQESFDSNYPVNFVVQYDGSILIAPPGILESSCNLDITWFPFDEQICCLKYRTWTYHANMVNLSIDPDTLVDDINQMDLQYYIPNGEWELLGTPGDVVQSQFRGEQYAELHYRLHLKRRAFYYVMNLLIPTIIISLTNLPGFMLPSECGEKITLQITNLLAVVTMLSQLSAVTPTTSDLPLLGIFFSFTIVVLGCSVIMTILIINLHFRMPTFYDLPSWIQKIFLVWLPWLLLMKRPGYSFQKPKKRSRTRESNSSNDVGTDKPAEQLENSSPFLRNRKRNGARQPFLPALLERLPKNNSSQNVLPTSLIRIERLLLEYSAFFRDVRTYLEEDEDEKAGQADWRFIAKVADRLCFLIFTFAIMLAFLIILASAPRAYMMQHSYPRINCSYTG